MNPIFEQGQGQGIGYGYRHFLQQFLNICNDHLENKRAKSFAFILYDFHDENIRTILKKQGVFTQLDRLSGKDLTLFYIDSENKKIVKEFNKIFLGAFDIEDKFQKPLVLFFNINGNEVEDIEIVELQQDDLIYSFKELYDIISNYIERAKNSEIKKFENKINKLYSTFSTIKKVALEKIIELIITQTIDKLN